MTEADILAMTYDDMCTVYRPFKDNLNNAETILKTGVNGKIVYENVPCALSSQSGGKLQQSNTVAKVPCDYLLFVRPEIDIQPSDTVVVTHLHKNIVANAGLADRLLSHNNVPLKLAKEIV